MSQAGFKPAVPASKLPLNHALDSAVTGIGREFSLHHNVETGSGAHQSSRPKTNGHSESRSCRLQRPGSVARR